MQIAETVLETIRDSGRPVENLYRHLYNPDLFLRAYGRLYRSAGATTQGITRETTDGMSMAKINALIEAFRCGRYEWTPVKRIYIPKKNGGDVRSAYRFGRINWCKKSCGLCWQPVMNPSLVTCLTAFGPTGGVIPRLERS